MLKRLKEMRDNKKGFTLVELIVVLVILAILAALLIPALTGYIDKAKEKQVVAETRQVVMAAQTLVDEQYSAGGGDVTYADIAKLAEVKENNITDIEIVSGTSTASAKKVTVSSTTGKILKVVYASGGKSCTYTYDTTKNEGKYETN